MAQLADDLRKQADTLENVFKIRSRAQNALEQSAEVSLAAEREELAIQGATPVAIDQLVRLSEVLDTSVFSSIK